MSLFLVLQSILTGTDAEEQLLAATVVTNMAAGGSQELCEAALNTAPHLIQFLDSQNVALVDQSTWALGNIAAEGPKSRDRLRNNGVLPPLIKLLESKVNVNAGHWKSVCPNRVTILASKRQTNGCYALFFFVYPLPRRI